MQNAFQKHVALRYQLYNSLFLLLPFEGIYRTGTLLPLFAKSCTEGYAQHKTPQDIIKAFMRDYLPEHEVDSANKLLFQFIQYIERQVVLFDSIEDASFQDIKDLRGKGSLNALKIKLNSKEKIETLQHLINEVSVRVVLTAHPTQFYPGEVLAIITDLDSAIRKADIGEIELLLRQLGKTPFIKKLKPSPYDEAVSLIWYLEHIFYDAVPSLVKSILKTANVDLKDWTNTNLISVGFWPGGDRDGNPFVNAEITLNVAEKLKTTLMKCYYRDLRKIRRRLSFKGVFPLVIEAESKIFSAAYGNNLTSYPNAEAFLIALNHILDILHQEHDGLFAEVLEELIIKVKIFGFHLAQMDIRQHNKKHKIALSSLLQNEGIDSKIAYEQMDEAAQLKSLLSLERFDYQADQLEAKELIESIQSMRKIQEHNGELGCNRYIISNANSAIDVLEIFVLARHVFGNQPKTPIDVIPLFESIDDLKNADQIMAQLYSQEDYRAHLKARGNKQIIMLGFSDGTKDGGYLKANWSIFKAKEELTKISRLNGVEVTFFDGRGGPPGRGGGNTYEFYASQGSEIESNSIQLTVQGQTISSNYGKQSSCKHNLEQLFCALVDNKLFSKENTALNEEDRNLLERLANEAYKAYLELKNNPSFVPYLDRATPLRWFGATNIGSRPAKRNAKEGLIFADLRAIPFVGSWAQMKQNVPGYYGLGSAIENLNENEKLIALCEKSPFFRTLLSNSMQSLTKCNFDASAWLLNNEEFSSFYKLLIQEYEKSKIAILQISNQKELMEDFPLSKASVLLRENIVLPLVTIQQFALQKLNNETLNEAEKAVYERLVLRCMFGIINAARNAA